jgi:hypothetical protein
VGRGCSNSRWEQRPHAGAPIWLREPEAERAEQAVRETDSALTVLRSTGFIQKLCLSATDAVAFSDVIDGGSPC